MTRWFSDRPRPAGISPKAVVAESARLGKNVTLGPFAVIGENVVIGNNVTIFQGVSIEPAIDVVVNRYYSDVVGRYWPAERVLVEKFEELPFAFEEIEVPAFEMTAQWNVEQLFGYLRTWSATQRFMAAQKRDPLYEVAGEVRKAWRDEVRRVVWPLAVRVGRV